MLKSVTLRTDRSAVIRAYPWLNGIVLSENKYSYLDSALKNSKESRTLIDAALVGDSQNNVLKPVS